MWLTIAIAGALFAAMIAILWFGYEDRERQAQARADAVLENAPEARPGSCLLCGAPLRRAANSDQVVFELEHRIDAELADIARVLRAPSGGFQQLYRA